MTTYLIQRTTEPTLREILAAFRLVCERHGIKSEVIERIERERLERDAEPISKRVQ